MNKRQKKKRMKMRHKNGYSPKVKIFTMDESIFDTYHKDLTISDIDYPIANPVKVITLKELKKTILRSANMNKRQVKKYYKRNYCWTYQEYTTGNIYSFIQWEGTRSGKSKVLLHNGSKGNPWVSRNHRVYYSEVLKEAYEQFNKDVISGKYSNIVTYPECDHLTSQSFEIQTVGRLTT